MTESQPESFLDFVSLITSDFEREGFEYAISGAMANVVWGVPRTTRDVDIIVSVSQMKIPRVLDILAGHGCAVDMRRSIEELRDKWFTSLEHRLGDVELFVPAVPYHRALLKRRVKKVIDGKQMWFVSAEDLIILKMVFHRLKDLSDVKAIISVQTGRLDREYIMSTFRSLLPPHDERVKELGGFLSS